MRRALLLFAFLSAACRTTRALDAAAPQLLSAHHVPGAAVAVINHGRITVRTYGVADSESKAPVEAQTVFEAASIGKVVFAYAVLRLAGRGALDLDRPLQSYLPEPYINDPRAARITARMVLAHRTGLPNWRPQGKELALLRDPDVRFGYSGEGFLFLQKAVEAITGEPAESWMRREVFQPLGMSHSSYVSLPEYEQSKAWGHNAAGGHWRRRKAERANVASTLHTTAPDLARFVAALMRQDATFRVQSRVPASCPMCADAPAEEASEITWGLGVGLLEAGGRRYFWHWGDNGDFQGYVFGNSRRAVVILTNGANGLAAAAELARLALHDDAAVRPLVWLGYVSTDNR